MLAVAGCDGEDVAAPQQSPDGPSPHVTASPEAAGSPTPGRTDDKPAPPGQPAPGGGDQEWRTGEVPEQYMEQVIADAARRTGVPSERIEVIRAEAVQWRDGSLGCPEPGQSYIQMIVDGYWVVLAAGGEQLDYRLDDRGTFRLCDQPSPQPPYSDDR
jgi:hypothetical protein